MKKANHIQISFDLLGEIIKFNRFNLISFNKICSKKKCFDSLMKYITDNIVDSNVFLRALILTYEKIIYLKKIEVNNLFYIFCFRP